MSVLICCPDRLSLHLLEQQVYQAGHRPICCIHADRVLETAREQLPDSILVVHDPPASDGIALAGQIRGNYTCPLVLAADHWDGELAKAATSAGYAAFLGMPATGTSLVPALLQAEAGHNELRYLKDRVAELEQRLAERKLVEKAKGMVMLQQQLSEEQAFRTLRSEAMRRRISLARLAEELLASKDTGRDR
ncbi:ANTAR domain-containing response regulator [Trichlorobacter ammonificans]|uniref:Response regulator receiver and ANTAR domain protein n=1 Tax=Trichlorobacter ammonificans TaxID=2916410 RepID=A0ABM9D3S6_9BACT|nr:ANTAR domain-containing protein [Trichlorobacter ammonificans]CAH2029865.1 Response regulator receiver and ANTAR domain protein [Trichlorobacter ammonificans]